MTFEKWDPEIVKEEEGADGDSHDQTGLSGQELSKFALCFVPLVHNINIYYLCSSIHINCIPGGSQYHQACERTLDLKKVFIPSLWTTQFLGTSHFSNMLCFFFCKVSSKTCPQTWLLGKGMTLGKGAGKGFTFLRRRN